MTLIDSASRSIRTLPASNGIPALPYSGRLRRAPMPIAKGPHLNWPSVPNARLDPGQVEDVRGSRIGGRGLAIGGGGLGTVVLLVVYLLLGGNLDSLVGGQDPNSGQQPQGSTLQQCNTGADANQREECRIVGYVNSIQKFWTGEFNQAGQRYEPANTAIYSDQVSTGCGLASSQVRPFYCPPDDHVYIDLGFFQDLQTKFG